MKMKYNMQQISVFANYFILNVLGIVPVTHGLLVVQ